MKHLKRQKVPKTWPIPRKGTKYVVKSNSNIKNGIPVLIALRDMLKIAQNRKEVKKAIHLKQILVNNKIVVDEKKSILLFDTITIIPAKKNYRITLAENGKFTLEEIKETEANFKVAKIINKKTLKGKKTQLNLSDGRNFISNIKCKVNDSILINLKDGKIEKCLALGDKTKVIVFAGKHAGKKGIVRKMKEERKMAGLTTENGDINVLIKQIMVIE